MPDSRPGTFLAACTLKARRVCGRNGAYCGHKSHKVHGLLGTFIDFPLEQVEVPGGSRAREDHIRDPAGGLRRKDVVGQATAGATLSEFLFLFVRLVIVYFFVVPFHHGLPVAPWLLR